MARNADTGESKYVSPSFLPMKQQWQCLWGKKNEQLANVVSSAEQTRRQACSEWAQVSRRDLAWPGQDCSVRAPIARPCFSSVKLHSMENSSFSESKSHVARSICFDSYWRIEIMNIFEFLVSYESSPWLTLLMLYFAYIFYQHSSSVYPLSVSYAFCKNALECIFYKLFF